MIETQNHERPLTEAQGQTLIRLARQAIGRQLGLADQEDPGLADQLADPAFARQRATFVTLKINGRLRGCIGSLAAYESIVKNIRRNAVNAAFHDHRFKPLTATEFEKILISISVLTPSRPLEHGPGRDLIRSLRPGVDGVTVSRQGASATFLPQVWDQLPRPEDFLTHLCLKAGLPADAWQQPDLAVSTYQVQYFKEQP
ncbi:MAG: AmmeMemoRadiSam system protein A [Desulfobacterales bacterium]|nr:AmmeMemoRadiSam system protein A [Desulfobacterales bacterium]